MQTLDQLVSGKLKGITHLKLSCNLTDFPKAIFELADTLEILDLSNNSLSSLPNNFADLKKLKIAFFSENNFNELPEVLGKCPHLTMIGFKSNRISFIPENAFPNKLQWLILTNNQIQEIPKSIGKCFKLQKVALAGNKLKTLPKEMSQCKNIELLRISANQLTEFPLWLFTLPRLSWLAFSGNPFCYKAVFESELPLISWQQLTIKETLGEGASGIISKAQWQTNDSIKDIAIKVFKGEVTSDGYPEDEMNACIAAGNHPNLVSVIGKIEKHPEQKTGLLLNLIPTDYKNLAGPSSFKTCTRDTFKAGTSFTANSILKIISSVASSANHLHRKGIMHGDLYAHNTLYDNEANTIFGDFGAATMYELTDENAMFFEKIDVRAFGCMIEDLLNLAVEDKQHDALFQCLQGLKNICLKETITDRPSFEEILKMLDVF